MLLLLASTSPVRIHSRHASPRLNLLTCVPVEMKDKAAEVAGVETGKAEGKAAEVAGEAKGKAAELKGQAIGKKEEIKGKMS